ncbi:hypothetical protein EVAR_52002_1 [Eumeta japonica]|uniref:Uncharacterized protein n=1 Tax=Eumeta variegata TaxID=151549 RepID=A0A4C1Y3E2_EUMVA|nr:hypothetical protein EVAR_52002_1 [Eumeta japonica]
MSSVQYSNARGREKERYIKVESKREKERYIKVESKREKERYIKMGMLNSSPKTMRDFDSQIHELLRQRGRRLAEPHATALLNEKSALPYNAEMPHS